MMKHWPVQVAFIFLLPVIPAAAAGLLHPQSPWRVAPDRASGRMITLEQAQQHASTLWIDARREAQYDQQHHPGALLLNEDVWEREIVDVLTVWAPGTVVIVYCESTLCAASHDVAKRLEEEAGIDDVRVLRGGWQTLVKAGAP